MPFSGPDGQGPFEDHSDCAASMEDEEGIDDADALCAMWEREAEGRAETKMRFDELDRSRLIQAAIDHPDLVGGGVIGDGDMTPRHRSAVEVGFDVVGGPATEIAQRADGQFDPDDPPEEVSEAIEADNFIIYGKASVEKVDLKGTRISVDALERALTRFFDSKDAPGIISRGHSDVVVGMPVREHTLESDTTLTIDGESYHFDAGETIRTEPKDADGDDVEELWLVSRLANDTDIARETRYKALTGELNGYSVTVKPKDGATRPTEGGDDILAVDLHAVTVGTDEQILNKDAEFDVAEFRALFGDDSDIDLTQLTDDALDRLAEDLGKELATLVS